MGTNIIRQEYLSRDDCSKYERFFFAKVPMFLYIVETIIRTIRDIRMFGWTTATLSVGDLVYMICVCVCECKCGYTVKDGMAMAQYKVTQCSRRVCVFASCRCYYYYSYCCSCFSSVAAASRLAMCCRCRRRCC